MYRSLLTVIEHGIFMQVLTTDDHIWTFVKLMSHCLMLG